MCTVRVSAMWTVYICDTQLSILANQWYIYVLSHMTDETTVAMTNIYVAVTDNIIPFRISITLPHSKHCSAELLLRAGLISAAYMHEYLTHPHKTYEPCSSWKLCATVLRAQ